MSPNTRTILVAAANLLAIFLVIGVLSTMNNNSDKDTAPAAKTPVATMAEMSIPTTTSGGSTRNRRDLRAKGDKMVGGKGKGSEDCIPLYPTPAPSKGKGTSLMKGSSNSTKGSGLSFKGKGSSNSTSFKGKGGSNSTSFKGKGGSSMAPSYYCSDAPSVAPSTSVSPSEEPTDMPSVSPSVSSAPTCSGKGSCKMSSKGGGKGKSMMP